MPPERRWRTPSAAGSVHENRSLLEVSVSPFALPAPLALARAVEAVPESSGWMLEPKLWTGVGVCLLSGARGGAAAGGEDAVEVVAEYGDG